MTWDHAHYLRATWTHQNRPIFIGQMKDNAIVGSWDRGPWSSLDRSRRSVFTESDGPRFLLTFSYKNWCSSICILTFDQIVKQLRKFWGRSWVHLDSLASRLNRDPIGAGFIVINHRIRSNSPLECRTSAEEEIKPILFNTRELKPNLHRNQVRSENQSFILR